MKWKSTLIPSHSDKEDIRSCTNWCATTNAVYKQIIRENHWANLSCSWIKLKINNWNKRDEHLRVVEYVVHLWTISKFT